VIIVPSRFLSFISALLVWGTLTTADAQQSSQQQFQKPQHQKELEALLESYPEETEDQEQANFDTIRDSTPAKKSLSVYSQSGRTKIADVDGDADYTITRQNKNWLLVRFSNPTVPVWISDDYIFTENGKTTVRASRLNARLRPSISSPIIASLPNGYQAKVLAQSDNFTQILVGQEALVAIANSVDNRTSNWAESSSASAPVVPGTKLDQKTQSQSQAGVEVVPESAVVERKSVLERQHLIAPGDAISLLVFGESDLSVENIRVPESGRVSLPLIGSVGVGGQTTRQVEDNLRKILSEGYVKNPRLSVTIFSYRPIFIRGAVRSTGSFPYTEGLSVAKAIALAGGSKNSAKANGVSIMRDGEIIESGLALDSRKKVASGDVITIGEELGVSEDPTLFVYLHGEVVKPGEYLFRRGLTVEKAIVLAGGFTLRGSPRKIKVTRYTGQGKDQEPVKLKGVKLYTPIEPGDVIKIGARWF